MNVLKQIPERARLLERSDYVDIKTVESRPPLREFIPDQPWVFPALDRRIR
jgi:hypothetical protein